MLDALSRLRRRSLPVGLPHSFPVWPSDTGSRFFFRRKSGTAGFLVAGIFLAMFFGLFLALGITLLDMLLFGICGAITLLFVPLELVLWAMLILSFLVVGQLIYFARINQAFWIPYLFGGLLFIRLPMEAARARFTAAISRQSMPGFLWALYLFFVIFVVSATLNRTPLLNVLVGAKNYIFLWSVVFVMAAAAITEKHLRQLIYGLLLIGFLQMPFALYQHFVVAAKRSQTAAAGAFWDAVVGSFGGNPDAGGSSGTLAIYLTVSITLAAALFKHRRIGWQTASILVLCAFGTMLLAEIKIVLIILPAAMLLLFRADMLRNPAKAFAGFASMLAAVAVIFITYQQTYWADNRAGSDPIESFTKMLTLDTQGGFVNYETREVGRFASLGIWWRENSRLDNAKLLIGHGPTASRISNTIGYGNAAKNYRFSLDTSSATVLLWDVGILGFGAFAAVLLAGALGSQRLANDSRVPQFHRAVLGAIAVSLTIFTLTLVYDRDAVDNPALQVLVSFCLGYVLHWHRRAGTGKTLETVAVSAKTKFALAREGV